MFAAPVAHAQSARFGGLQTVSALNFASYGGVLAGHPAGNVFVADDQNREMVEFSAQARRSEPEYMAPDDFGNLYVTTAAPSQVVKLKLSGGVYGAPQVIASGFQAPLGIAVDDQDHVFVAGHATGVIYKLTPNLFSSTYSSAVYMPAGTLNGPVQMSMSRINSVDNLYIADQGNNRVLMVNPPGKLVTPFAPVAAAEGVAVDGTGNVAITGSAGLTYEQVTAGVTRDAGGEQLPDAVRGGFRRYGKHVCERRTGAAVDHADARERGGQLWQCGSRGSKPIPNHRLCL